MPRRSTTDSVPAAAPTAVVELIEFSPTLQSKENYFSCYDDI